MEISNGVNQTNNMQITDKEDAAKFMGDILGESGEVDAGLASELKALKAELDNGGDVASIAKRAKQLQDKYTTEVK